MEILFSMSGRKIKWHNGRLKRYIGKFYQIEMEDEINLMALTMWKEF